jgi:gliding motility-associated-like protein
MNILQKLFLIGGLLLSGISFSQSNTTCEDMLPFCADTNITFTATSNGPSAQAGNNYNCLGSQPNPSWYYLGIDTAGTINMTLSAPSDIDFIVYGPFSSLADATSGCGNMGNGGTGSNVVDCSYSATNNETPSIPNAQVGEFYVVLITNYANSVQQVTLTQNNTGQPGAGSTDCGVLSTPPCSSDPGTFVHLKNGVPTALDIYLCEGDNFSIVSNQDYILPNDSLAAPVGDGIYSAQLMWLVYSGAPNMSGGVVIDPLNDPNFLGLNNMIPSDNLNGTNSGSDPLFQALGGCGDYWFVPVAGDDGVGGNNNVANGTNDNGGLHWDKDGNNCYLFGDPVKVTFACPIQTTPTTNCNTLNNGVDIAISGGLGNYNIINQGQGNLVNSSVPNPGTAQIQDLINGNTWNIDITDGQGCTTSANGTFSAPTIIDTNFVPALACNGGGSTGTIEVVLGNTGTPGYTVDFNGTNAPGPNYIFTGTAGTGVSVLVTDNLGCTVGDFFTVTSADHYIDVQITAQTGELCYGDGNGSATITAQGVDANGVPDGSTITTIDWTSPSGTTLTGGNSNTSQTGMEVGTWAVTVTDNTGCDVTIPIVIDGPQDLVIYSTPQTHDPYCYNQSDGQVNIEGNGGTPFTTGDQYIYSWNPNNPSQPTNSSSNVTNDALAGTYWAYVEDAGGCTDSVEIILNNPPEIEAFFTIKDIKCHGINDGGIIVDSVHYAAGDIQYLWNLITVTDPADSINIANGLPPGSYEITIKDATQPTPCQVTYSDLIVEDADPILIEDYVVTKIPLCRTESSQDAHGQISVTVSGGLTTSGTGNDFTGSYWQNNSTGDTWNSTTYPGINSGYYTFFAVNELGCIVDSTVYLDSISPIANFTATSPQFTSDYVGTAPVNVTFENTSENYDYANNPGYNGNNANSDVDTLFTWYFTDAENNTEVLHTESLAPILKDYLTEGLYTVCLEVEENLNHCIDSTCIDIQIYDEPKLIQANVFTPDGDGINDYFYFPNKAIIEFSAVITDRWGNVVFEFDNINTKWDGTNKNGKMCTDGTYFYVYEGNSSNGTKYKGQGNVQLISGGK